MSSKFLKIAYTGLLLVNTFNTSSALPQAALNSKVSTSEETITLFLYEHDTIPISVDLIHNQLEPVLLDDLTTVLLDDQTTPTLVSALDNLTLSTRQVDHASPILAKRVFSSPHVKKAFKVVAGNMISAASWTFNLWVTEDDTGKGTIWYSDLRGGGVSSPHIGMEVGSYISKSDSEIDAKLQFVVNGIYAGKELVCHFVIRLLSDAGETAVQFFYDRPTATLGGTDATVSSWDLVSA